MSISQTTWPLLQWQVLLRLTDKNYCKPQLPKEGTHGQLPQSPGKHRTARCTVTSSCSMTQPRTGCPLLETPRLCLAHSFQEHSSVCSNVKEGVSLHGRGWEPLSFSGITIDFHPLPSNSLECTEHIFTIQMPRACFVPDVVLGHGEPETQTVYLLGLPVITHWDHREVLKGLKAVDDFTNYLETKQER